MNVDYALDALELLARLLSILVVVAASATWIVGHAAAYWPTQLDRKRDRWLQGAASLMLVLLGAAIAFGGGLAAVTVLWAPDDGARETKYLVAMLVYPAVAFLNGIWTLTLVHRFRQEITKLAESSDGPRVTSDRSDRPLVTGLARSSAMNWWLMLAPVTVFMSFAATLREDARLGDNLLALGSAFFTLVVGATLIAWGYRAAPRARVWSAATRLVLDKSRRRYAGPEVLTRIRYPRAPLPEGTDLADAIDRVRWGERSMAKTDREAVDRATHELAEAARRAAWRDDRAFVRNCALAACALHTRNAVEVSPALTDWLGETRDEDAPRRERAKRFWEAIARGAMLAAFLVSLGTLISQFNDVSSAL